MANEIIDELLNSDWYLELSKLHHERQKTIKRGDNVIHLEYLGGLIEENEIKEIEKTLSSVNIELSSYDKSGLPRASIDDYINVVFFAIHAPLITDIIHGVLTGFVWDSIKLTIKKVWNKIAQKQYFKVSSDTSENRNITFGVQVYLNKNTGFNFRLEGELSEDIINDSLDKVIDCLKDQQLNKTYKHPYLMIYNTKSHEWKKFDVEEQIKLRKKTKKQE